MKDAFRKVLPGEPVQIAAQAWNRVIDQVTTRPRFGAGGSPFPAINFQVRCRNSTSGVVPRWGVLQIDGVLETPTGATGVSGVTGAGTLSFLEYPGVIGVTPTDTAGAKFVVATQPIKAGEIGMAAIDGVVQVKLDMRAPGHLFATVKAGSSEQMKSDSSGDASILWAGGGTGVQWGLVRIGSGAGGGVRLGKYEPTGTTGPWVPESLSDVNLYEDGTPPSEASSDEVLEDVVNHSKKVPHGSWVLCERSPVGNWYLVEAGSTGPSGCHMEVAGEDLREVAGYDQMAIQVLGHTAMTSGPSGATGCASLQWYSVTGCTGATGS